jgi:hypothetical protein
MNRTEIRKLALSLYASARRIERLPRETHYSPRELVEIVKIPEHLIPAYCLTILATPDYEEI